MRNQPTGERGSVTLLVTFVMVALCLSASLVVDLGLARDTRGRAQNAADASALAAGNVLYDDAGKPQFASAVAAAVTYAERNFQVPEDAWAECADAQHLAVTLTTACISFDDEHSPSLVRVRLPMREVPTAFGGLTGVDTIDISATATAMLQPAVVFQCSLCALGPGPHTLGNGDATVTASSVHFNGSVSTGPNGHVEAIGDGHEITVEVNATGNYSPPAETHSQKMGDPLGDWAIPPIYGQPKTNPCADGPGIYAAATLGNKDVCTLQPGLYVLTGTWAMGNKTILTGEHVTLYATCGTRAAPRACATSGERGGMFDATNSNGVSLTAGAPGFGDIAILYDRHNTNDVHVQGNGETKIFGTIYALSSLLYANGNSGNEVSSGSIIVDSLYMNGQNSHLVVTNGIDRQWHAPPTGLHLSD